MTTIIKELYNLYKIYNKLNSAITNSTIVTDEYCREIKDMIHADGCIAIKFAQWIISRLRSEPGKHIEYVVNYFDDIFDNCPFHTIDYTYEVFNEYSHYSLSEIVIPDSLKEIASGSVGQIYRATLKYPFIVCTNCDNVIMHYEQTLYLHNEFISNNHKFLEEHKCQKCNSVGRTIHDIAIKIKHPDVNAQVASKVKLFRLLTILQNIKWVKNILNLHMDMNDFIDNLTKQIDFRNEYENNRKFRVNFKGNMLIEFPIALEANKDILISEFIETQSFDDLPEYTQYKQCLNYACMVSQMVLVDNFVHADLHHKNWQIKQMDTESANDGAYKIIVFDTGICFYSDNLSTNRTIWEAFESADVDQIMCIMDKVIVGTYTENIKQYIKPILEDYRNTTLNIGYIMNEINSILMQYNCRMSGLCLNIILLLCLIDTTLKKHNLIGSPSDKQSLTSCHQNILRAKNLDLIAYLRSNPGCYTDVLTYFEDKQTRLFSISNTNKMGLFGMDSELIFDIPLD